MGRRGQDGRHGRIIRARAAIDKAKCRELQQGGVGGALGGAGMEGVGVCPRRRRRMLWMMRRRLQKVWYVGIVELLNA